MSDKQQGVIVLGFNFFSQEQQQQKKSGTEVFSLGYRAHNLTFIKNKVRILKSNTILTYNSILSLSVCPFRSILIFHMDISCNQRWPRPLETHIQLSDKTLCVILTGHPLPVPRWGKQHFPSSLRCLWGAQQLQ